MSDRIYLYGSGFQKSTNVADCFRIHKHRVKETFVDETLIQIDGKDHWLWISCEPNIKRCLMTHISRERTILVCYQFFRQLRNRFGFLIQILFPLGITF
ncbi:MAG: DDE-type integrase/transposase/recombinase [Nitrososphaeraceae archaeon]|nr:DDE-type integrase/transposase/recombinase [Nitrososphaeraceae archaeon]MBV9667638.1 DDE-type integrase/transposase/recombinase [Nitrososphaeraceae archaeon]